MPINDRIDDKVAPAFNESGMTFGDGMDRAAIELRRTDGKTEAARDEIHETGLFRSKDRNDLTDYSHQNDSQGLFGRIGNWFSQKGEEIKDSSVGQTVSHAGSGLEAKAKEEQAWLQRKSEQASEKHDDSFLTTLGHKAEEAKLFGQEKLHGLKADIHKEQVKSDFGIKNPENESSSLFGIKSSDSSKELDAEVRKLQDSRNIIETPDANIAHRLGHRIIDGKQMHDDHIGNVLQPDAVTSKLPDSQNLITDSTLSDTVDGVSGIDLNGIHAATRDAIRAQNQTERHLFHGRSNIMDSSAEGIKFDAADRTKFGGNPSSSSSSKETISEKIHDAFSGLGDFTATNTSTISDSKYKYDPRIEGLPAADVDPVALSAFRTEDF